MPTWTQFLALFDAYGAAFVVLVVLIVVVLLLRKLWPTITQAVTSVNSVAMLPETLARIEKDLATLKTDMGHVKHEVQTNSGGSLKDSAKVTEKTVKSMQGTVRKLNTRVGQLEKGQARAAELALAAAADLAQGKPPAS